jgi:hypothetical protein
MPKPRQRVCLQNGLKLDINKLARQGLLQPGAKAAPFMFRWTNNYTGETVATALITTHLLDYAGWFRIQMGELDQWIDLVSFGGRHEWETQVAYASQFDTPVDRAHRGKAKIKAKLIGTCDPDEWDLPPKPKWMRWRTYNKHVDKFDCYEGVLNWLCLRAAKRILNSG